MTTLGTRYVWNVPNTRDPKFYHSSGYDSTLLEYIVGIILLSKDQIQRTTVSTAFIGTMRYNEIVTNNIHLSKSDFDKLFALCEID